MWDVRWGGASTSRVPVVVRGLCSGMGEYREDVVEGRFGVGGSGWPRQRFRSFVQVQFFAMSRANTSTNLSPDEIKAFKAMSADSKRGAITGKEIWPVEAIGAKRGGEVQLTVVHRGTGGDGQQPRHRRQQPPWAGSLVVLLC